MITHNQYFLDKTLIFKLLFTLFFTVINFTLIAQNIQIKGNVVDENGISIDYFNAILLSPKDSTIVKGGAFADGKFDIQNSQDCILKITSLGYVDKYVDVKIEKQNNDLGKIILLLQELNEVIVTATKPILKLEEDKLVMTVENSYLSDIGTSIDILRRTPMLIVDSKQQIFVAGRANALIYINGKKIKSLHELQNLKSSDVKQIEVLTNPSAKYEASGHSVINIFTIKPKLEGIYGAIKGESTFAREQTYLFNTNLGYKNKNMIIAVNYSLTDYNSKTYENTLMNNHVENVITDVKGTTISSILAHDYSTSLDYHINNKNKIGIQYKGWFNSGTSKGINCDKYSINNLMGEQIVNKHEKPEDFHNSINLNYNIKLDTLGQKLFFLLDYTNHLQKNATNIEENDDNMQSTVLRRFNEVLKYDLYSLKIDYSLPLKKHKITLNIGIKYANALNNSNTIFEEYIDNSWSIDDAFDNNYDFTEEISASYFSLSKKINTVNIETGLRVENTYFKGNSKDLCVIDTSYINFFPSISLSNKFTKNFNASITYSKRIKRPSFYNLSPFIYYVDQYSYRQGIPTLKPTISDVVELSFFYKKVTFNMGYSYKKNATIYVYSSDTENPAITRITLENHEKIDFFSTNITHNFSKDKFGMNNSFGIKIPNAQVNYMGSTIDMNKPLIYFKHSDNILLPFDIMLFVDFVYIDYGHILLEEKEPLYNLSLGINKKFLKKKLILSIVANDILDSYNWKDLRNINDYEVIHEYIPDNTYIRISLRYNFGISKSVFRFKSGNKEELKRL